MIQENIRQGQGRNLIKGTLSTGYLEWATGTHAPLRNSEMQPSTCALPQLRKEVPPRAAVGQGRPLLTQHLQPVAVCGVSAAGLRKGLQQAEKQVPTLEVRPSMH